MKTENKKAFWLVFTGCVLFVCFVALTIFIVTSVNDKSDPPTEGGNFEILAFNNQFEALDGPNYPHNAQKLLDRIAENNTENPNQIIAVAFNGQTYLESAEILAIKDMLDIDTEYLFTLDYNDKGYVNFLFIDKNIE